MTLTTAEKIAGRLFRDERQASLDALNEARPPGEYVLVLWRVPRHLCPAADGASIGITLREVREQSPEYSPGRRFTFTWKEGKCPRCGLAVRTRKGRFTA